MNRKVKAVIFILATAIAFTMIACNKSGGGSSVSVSGGGGKSFNSAEELKEYLDKQPANTPDKPILVTMNANAPMLEKISEAINSAGKYVSLNLSGNALTSIPSVAFFNESTRKGCVPLVAITIPNSVTSIGEGAFRLCTSLTSVKFEGTIASSALNYDAFGIGDIRNKYLAGGPGTYTRQNGESRTWTKQ